VYYQIDATLGDPQKLPCTLTRIDKPTEEYVSSKFTIGGIETGPCKGELRKQYELVLERKAE